MSQPPSYQGSHGKSSGLATRDSCSTYRKISTLANQVQDVMTAALRLVEEIESQDNVSPRIQRKAEVLKEKLKALDSI